ncbi:hypothetical protein, partial [Limnobacter sp.]|uniref:hypothetical protein n=1 Tax=Limnobacter sp. TaxID=2003368 RepID=UPI002FE2D3D5
MNILQFLLAVANFVQAARHQAIVLMLTLCLFVAATYLGASAAVQDTLQGFELPPWVVAIGILIFCYVLAHLAVSSMCWLLKTAKVFVITGWSKIRSCWRKLLSVRRSKRLALQHIESLVASLSVEELSFMQLFEPSGERLAQMTNTLLPNTVYNAHYSLTQKGLLAKETTAREHTELFSLAEEVVTPLRRLLFNGTV